MSYDLYFWRQTKDMQMSPGDTDLVEWLTQQVRGYVGLRSAGFQPA